MSFSRDTDIGYATADDAATILVRLETLLTAGITTNPTITTELDSLIDKIEDSLNELKLIRKANELILGQDVVLEVSE